MNTTDILAALAEWDQNPQTLVGVSEDRHLEFKREPYRLDSDEAKAEFAKDIAAMANAGGGVIVLGVVTERGEATGRDVSSRLRPIPPGLVDIGRMEQVAQEWVYPPMRDIEIKEWPNSEGKLLVSILVPPIDDAGALALVRGGVLEDRLDRRMVGAPIRSQAGTSFLQPSEMYEYIRRGRLRQEAAIATEEAGRDLERAAASDIERARSEFGQRSGEVQEPVWLVQAWPRSTTRLERIHDREGVRGLLMNPPSLRDSGFNLAWFGGSVEPDRGAGIRLSGGERAGFWVSPQAIATLAGVVDRDFLAWAMEKYRPDPDADQRIINPTALVELTHAFSRTFYALLGWADPKPREAGFRIGLLAGSSDTVVLLGSEVAGDIRHAFTRTLHGPSQPEFMERVEPVDLAEMRPEGTAARLLHRFYGHFAHPTTSIPFLTEDGSEIDVERLRSIR